MSDQSEHEYFERLQEDQLEAMAEANYFWIGNEPAEEPSTLKSDEEWEAEQEEARLLAAEQESEEEDDDGDDDTEEPSDEQLFKECLQRNMKGWWR